MVLESKYNLNDTVEFKNYKGQFTGQIYRIEIKGELQANVPIKNVQYWVRYGLHEDEFAIINEKEIIRFILIQENYTVEKL